MSEIQSTGNEPAIRPSVSEPAVAGPRGIGGWLLLVALSQIVGPLRLLVLLVKEYPEQQEAFEQFPVAAYSELAFNIVLLLLMIITAVLFFRKSRYFPRVFICELVTFVIFPIVTSAWLALALSIALDEPFGDHFLFEAQDVAQIGIAAMWALIWIPYTLISTRVKNTFGAPAFVAAAPPAAAANLLLRIIVFAFIAMGVVSILVGVGHAIGRGAFSGQLVSGALYIALAVWLFRGSNAARIILAFLSFAGFLGSVAVGFLVSGPDITFFMVMLALMIMCAVLSWVLMFSERLRSELRVNAAKYRKPEPEAA